MQKFLSQILPSIEYELFASDGKTEVKKEDVANVVITNLVFDSRKVTNGSLFFALPGIHSDGNKFIPDAIEKGANAIVYQGELSYDIKVSASKACVKRQIDNVLNGGKPSVFPAFIKVKNARFSMAPLSDCLV